MLNASRTIAFSLLTISACGAPRAEAQATAEYWKIPDVFPASLAEADVVANSYSPSTVQAVEQLDFVDNFYGPPYTGGGYFPQGVLFPGVAPIEGDASGEFFVFRVRGVVEIPATGQYTFGSNSDDGVRLRIGELSVLEHEMPIFEAYSTVKLAAGLHDLEVLYYGFIWADQLEIYAQPGEFQQFDAGFRVIGDAGNGGLRFVPEPSALSLILIGLAGTVGRRR